MDPELTFIIQWGAMRGKGHGASPPAAESPLKVWDGSAWVNASAPPTS
jgi:hypothetical protein